MPFFEKLQTEKWKLGGITISLLVIAVAAPFLITKASGPHLVGNSDGVQFAIAVGTWGIGLGAILFARKQNTILHLQNEIMERQNVVLDRQLDLQRDGQLEPLKERLRDFLQQVVAQKLRFDKDERRREILKVFYRIGLSRATIYQLGYLAALNEGLPPEEAAKFAGHSTHHGCPDDPEEIKAREKYLAQVRFTMKQIKDLEGG